MSEASNATQQQVRHFAKIAEVVSSTEVVMNKGSRDGVQEDEKFIVFAVGEEILDPDTKESLGQREIIRGKVKAVHVQARMTTLRTYETVSIRVKRGRTTSFPGIFPSEEYTEERAKVLDDPSVGDFVRRLR